jgi:hypothetical protein
MAPKRLLERWETKLANYKVKPQAMWPIAKSVTKGSGPKGPSANHSSLDRILIHLMQPT